MYQPPEPSGVGRCLRCESCIEECEQVGGICYECQPAEAGEQPAFPVQASDYGGHGTCFGLTTRDYFAAKALAAMIGQPHKEPENCGGKAVPKLAAWAYEYADAMLAARVKP